MILIAYDLTTQNGWGQVALKLAEGLFRNGVSLKVIVTGPTKISKFDHLPFQVVVQKNAEISDWKDFLKFLFKARLDLRNLLLGHDKILITYELPFLPVYLCAPKGSRIWGVVHGTYCHLGTSFLVRGFYLKMYTRMENIVAVSHYTKKRMLNHFPEAEQKLIVINSGVHPNIEEIIPYQQREKVILFVGALKPRKGAHLAIEAMAQIENVNLYFLGPIDEKNEYVQMIRSRILELNLEKRIKIWGRVSDVDLKRFFANSLLLLMPSVNEGNNFEGFGLVHLEAYSYGTPSIGSFDCGNEDAIINGQTGYLVRQGQVTDIVFAVDKIIKDERSWESFSKGALEYSKRSSWEKCINQYLKMVFGDESCI